VIRPFRGIKGSHLDQNLVARKHPNPVLGQSSPCGRPVTRGSGTSALGSEAETTASIELVRFVPKADLATQEHSLVPEQARQEVGAVDAAVPRASLLLSHSRRSIRREQFGLAEQRLSHLFVEPVDIGEGL